MPCIPSQRSVLLKGAMGKVGRRTDPALLRVMSLSSEKHVQKNQRVWRQVNCAPGHRHFVNASGLRRLC